jgi:hypothetical protein
MRTSEDAGDGGAAKLFWRVRRFGLAPVALAMSDSSNGLVQARSVFFPGRGASLISAGLGSCSVGCGAEDESRTRGTGAPALPPPLVVPRPRAPPLPRASDQ